MKRIEVHSHKPRVTAFLSNPNADKKKRYKVSVESLVVPAIESRILNTPLLVIKRRLLVPVGAAFDEDDLDLSDAQNFEFATFTPRNVRSLSHLAFQLNRFFHDFQLRITTAALSAHDVTLHEYDRVGTAFEQEVGADWYTLDKAPQVRAVVRSDGRLGFRFSVDFQKLFIVELTEEGQRIFGFKQYLAIDANGRWHENYLDEDGEPAFDLPAEADLQTQLVFTKSVFPFVDHRSELVVQCSLPLPTTGEGTESAGTFKRQLASYRFPEYQTQMEGGLEGSVLLRSMSEVREHSFELEKGLNTHNKFVVTGTDLQNFNILLVHRVHTWKTDKFVQTETEYEMPPESTFTLRMTVREVR